MIQTKYPLIYVDDIDVFKKMPDGTFHKLSKWVDNVGYYQVVFRVNGKRKYVRVHRLLMESHHPDANHKLQVNHIDGNKLNNHPSNLEWCSNSANTKAAYDLGLYKDTKACRVVAIHKDTGSKREFNSIRECATALNLNRKTITAILKQQKENNYPYLFNYL